MFHRQAQLALSLLTLTTTTILALPSSLSPSRSPETDGPLQERYDHSSLTGSSSVSSPNHLFNKVLIAHAVCGFLAWQIFAPLIGFLSLSTNARIQTSVRVIQWVLIVPLTFAACILGVYVVRSGEYDSPVSAHMVLGWIVLVLCLGWVVLPRPCSLKPTTSKLRQWALVGLTLSTLLLGGGNVQLGFGELLGALPRYITITCTIITLLPLVLGLLWLPYRWKQHRESLTNHSFLTVLLMPHLLKQGEKGLKMVPPRPRGWDNSSVRAPSFATFQTDERTLVPEEEEEQGWSYAKGLSKASTSTGEEGWEGPRDRAEYESHLLSQRLAHESGQEGYDGPGLSEPTPLEFEERAAMPLPVRTHPSTPGSHQGWGVYSPRASAPIRMDLPPLKGEGATRFPGSRPPLTQAEQVTGERGSIGVIHRSATDATSSSIHAPSYLSQAPSSPIIPPTFGQSARSPPALLPSRRLSLQIQPQTIRAHGHTRQQSSGSFVPKRLSLGSGSFLPPPPAPPSQPPHLTAQPLPEAIPSPSASVFSLGSTALLTVEHFTDPSSVLSPEVDPAEVPLPLSRNASVATTLVPEGEERKEGVWRVASGRWFSNK